MKNIMMKVDTRLFIFWNAILFLDEGQVESIFWVEDLKILLWKLWSMRLKYSFIILIIYVYKFQRSISLNTFYIKWVWFWYFSSVVLDSHVYISCYFCWFVCFSSLNMEYLLTIKPKKNSATAKKDYKRFFKKKALWRHFRICSIIWFWLLNSLKFWLILLILLILLQSYYCCCIVNVVIGLWWT